MSIGKHEFCHSAKRRCCLKPAASVPLLKILNVLQGKYLQYVKRYGSVRDLFNELDKLPHQISFNTARALETLTFKTAYEVYDEK